MWERPVELEGTIGEFTLRELIEMIVYSSVTGALELQFDGGGQIFFRDGLPYDAAAGLVTGLDGAALLFEASTGVTFRFIGGITSARETLWMDPWELIDHCEHQAERWSTLRPHIPSLEWVPVLHQAPQRDHIHISDFAWPLLSAVDGQRSIAEIADFTLIARLDVCTGLAELLQQRLITLSPPRPALAAPQTLQPEQPGENGFFERLITRTLEEERRRTSDPSLRRPSDPNLQRLGHE
jgi:hypothetical protein